MYVLNPLIRYPALVVNQSREAEGSPEISRDHLASNLNLFGAILNPSRSNVM
jgi:hypothetical protein